MLRVLFFGTPAFAVPCLGALLDATEVVGLVCQPDRPFGRGRKMASPPTKALLADRAIPVLQPTKWKSPETIEALRALRPDVAVVAAYGRILPSVALAVPTAGCINLHASLLPRWRGAAPIQWAVTEGDPVTGVSLMQMDEGLDTGPVFVQASVLIGKRQTSAELSLQLATLGADLLVQHLADICSGKLRATPQSALPGGEAAVTHAPLLKKSDGAIDFSASAIALDRRVRGMTPWPGAFASLRGNRIAIHQAAAVESELRGDSGVVTAVDAEGILVACGTGTLRLEEVQPDGKRRMRAVAFARGAHLAVGERWEVPAL